MIDIENEIFYIISTKLRERFGTIYVTGEYVKTPSVFPCVTLLEADNSSFLKTRTTTSNENHAELLYEINVYSNKTKGKKAECKRIISFVDNELLKLGFTRIMLNPIPNEEDATIYRIIGRYRAIVSNNNTIYRR